MDPATVALVLGLPALTLTAVGLGWGARALMAGETDRADEAERQLLQRDLLDLAGRLERAERDLREGRGAAEDVLAVQRALVAAGDRLLAPRERRRLLLRAGGEPGAGSLAPPGGGAAGSGAAPRPAPGGVGRPA